MKIEHIDEVRPHIEGRSDFVIGERDGFTVIDYVYADETTFAEPMRLECRGIKFGPDGRTLARPFAKFFNIGEKEATQPHRLDFNEPHIITEKLDGSMIHPAIIEGRAVFMTRMGRSDHAVKAEERHLDQNLHKACHGLLSDGWTPIFEWTAPDNRIVIPYRESHLTLLAIRNTVGGEYLSRDDLDQWAREAGVSLVPQVSSDWRDGHSFIEFARAVTGQEGFVIRFASGLWVKAKGEDYVMKHRAKDSIGLEKNALAVVLEGGVDDVLPLLTPEDAQELERYRDAVLSGVSATAEQVQALVDSGANLDQKTFAVEHLDGVDNAFRSLAFAVRAGKPAHDTVKQAILKSTGSRTRVENVRQLFNARWEEMMQGDSA